MSDLRFREGLVSLIKVHRLLIGSGIALCVLYTVLHGLRYADSNALSDLVHAAVALLAAVGLGFYFRSIGSHIG
jgi:hypothetical protein